MCRLTLGSLFDGSGGFPLGGLLCGIKPLWASEVEPFPIRVTTKRLPDMMHLGDINTLDGAAIPPVDIITGGFPCQNLSVAGKRAGLHGERSGLFFQMVRVIREMREVTGHRLPRFVVVENVPGMYTSNRGADFREVLNELVQIKDPSAYIPMPATGKWPKSGDILADDFSLAWRTLDAQFWGVPQRRRRCFLVVDFDGKSAGEILFNETRLFGNPPPRNFPWQIPAANSENSTGSPFSFDARGNGSGNIVNTLTGGHNDRITDYTALVLNERQYALTVGVDVANILTGTDYKGTQCVFAPKVYGICAKNSNSMKSSNPNSGVYEMEISRTLDTGACAGNGGQVVVAIEGNGARPSHHGNGFREGVSFTLNATEQHAVCYQDKVGALCASDYKFPQNQQIEEGKAVVERVVVENYQHSNYREVETAGTLKASGGDYPGGENVVIESRYVVRRLTPQECALLQGFPFDWCAELATPNPSEAEIAFWTEIFETHRRAVGKSKKPKSRNQIIKWLKEPHRDSAEYRLWGNGVALPCVSFVLGGIVYYDKNPP
ncbi:MAG: DNA (cytosine-5-)-methyltransferase [Defluviitaleaceae bacterium]|nr:DNA (cytosine-5-)-methyltransferase [Defluviitaleaceae bacterium]MCL2261670.1 DNA (cytosine-5-)-methyltransferase [Defluviitaleaceae bacterium]